MGIPPMTMETLYKTNIDHTCGGPAYIIHERHETACAPNGAEATINSSHLASPDDIFTTICSGSLETQKLTGWWFEPL